MIDLENDFSKNTEDTDVKNIVGVRPKKSVDVITIACKDFKCTQCTLRKQIVVQWRVICMILMESMDLNVCSVTLPPSIHIHFMCITTAIMTLTS